MFSKKATKIDEIFTVDLIFVAFLENMNFIFFQMVKNSIMMLPIWPFFEK